MRLFTYFIFFVLVSSCSEPDQKINEPKPVISLQPFHSMPANDIIYLKQDLLMALQQQVRVNILPSLNLPNSAYYAPRKRYRADSLIRFLKRRLPEQSKVIIGISPQDISTTKGSHADFGIMGLGFQPGNSCVVSTYRLNKQRMRQQLFKVAIHEFGHTQGLPHCASDTCYMRDAQGGNPLDEEKNFCTSCMKHLKKKGWVL